MKVLLMLLLMTNVSAQGQLESQLSERAQKSSAKRSDEVRAIMNGSLERLKDMGIAKNALGVGKKVPDISFTDLEGNKVKLSSFYKDGPIVLTFYRGGWCPYCMLELRAYESMIGKFRMNGVKVIAVSPDSVISSKKTKDKQGLSYPVLSDLNNVAAHEFGLAFRPKEDLKKLYEKFGIDLKGSQDSKDPQLPLPGTYVIDTKAIVRYSYADADYTKRAEPSDVLSAAKAIK